MRAGSQTPPKVVEPDLPQAAFAADTFLIALRRRESFDASRGDVRPWLFGIATRLVAEHRRKETRHYRALGRLRRDEAEGQVVDCVTAQSLQPRLARPVHAAVCGEASPWSGPPPRSRWRSA